jgi:hypothetical protein
MSSKELAMSKIFSVDARPNRHHKEKTNPHGVSYLSADSMCDGESVEGKCLECSLPKCIDDNEIPRVRNVITNTY